MQTEFLFENMNGKYMLAEVSVRNKVVPVLN
jgi:hypothetical protein